MRGQLAAGHGHERTVGALDDLQVADDEAVVERDRAECLKPFARLFHELDANLGDFHGRSPCDPETWMPAGIGGPNDSL